MTGHRRHPGMPPDGHFASIDAATPIGHQPDVLDRAPAPMTTPSSWIDRNSVIAVHHRRRAVSSS